MEYIGRGIKYYRFNAVIKTFTPHEIKRRRESEQATVSRVETCLEDRYVRRIKERDR